MSFLAAFGETRVHIESTNSPIRVTRAAKEQDAKDINRQRVIKSHKSIKHRFQKPIKDHKKPFKSGYMSSIVSAIFESGSKVYSASFSPFEAVSKIYINSVYV